MTLWLLVVAAAMAAPQPTRILYLGDSHSAGIFGHELDRLLRGLPGVKVRTQALGGSSPWWWFPKPASNGPTSKNTYFVEENGKGSTGERYPTPFSSLVSQFHPTVVVAALGANEQWSPANAEKSAKQMSDAIKAAGARCIWVAPARRRDNSKLDALYDGLKKGTAGKCDFVDSRYPWLQFPSGKDDVHYDWNLPDGPNLARRWGQAVYADIRLILGL